MFRRITRAERERRAAKAELDSTMQAMRAVDSAFREAQDPFSIEQLTYQHAALMCRCRAAAPAAGRQGGPMTAYWPYAAAVVCLLCVVRCAARQHCGLRSLLGGAVCGRGYWHCWACWSL